MNHAVACDLLYKETATARAYELTGLENPNSVSQLKLWLKEKRFGGGFSRKRYSKRFVNESRGRCAGSVKT